MVQFKCRRAGFFLKKKLNLALENVGDFETQYVERVVKRICFAIRCFAIRYVHGVITFIG